MSKERSIGDSTSFTLQGGGNFCVEVSLQKYQTNTERRIRTIELGNDLLLPSEPKPTGTLTERPKKRAPAITVTKEDLEIPDDRFASFPVTFMNHRGEIAFTATTGNLIIVSQETPEGIRHTSGYIRVIRGELKIQDFLTDEINPLTIPFESSIRVLQINKEKQKFWQSVYDEMPEVNEPIPTSAIIFDAA